MLLEQYVKFALKLNIDTYMVVETSTNSLTFKVEWCPKINDEPNYKKRLHGSISNIIWLKNHIKTQQFKIIKFWVPRTNNSKLSHAEIITC